LPSFGGPNHIKYGVYIYPLVYGYKMTEHDEDLWNKVKQAIQTDHDEFTIEPIREFLDDKETRNNYRGSMGKGGIGDYYCIPVDVLHKCGMSIDEIFFGKTQVEETERRRNE